MRPALVPILLADPLPWAKRADYAWDFLRDRARFAGGYKGALANTPNWTFTRASTAYYTNSAGVLTSVASGALRTGDRGALIEGAGTNLLTYSQEFDNAAWGKQNCTVTANTTAAPDGTITADTITASAGTAFHYITRSVAANTQVYSVYVKKGTSTWLFITNDDSGINYFNLDTGAFGTTVDTCTVTALANGWYRLTVYRVSDGGAGCGVGPAGSNGGANFAAAGTETVIVWGAQLEATAYASSYVPTTTGSATRAADSLTVTGVTGLDYPLSPYAEFERAADTVASAVALRISDAGGTHNARLSVNSSDLAQAYCEAASVAQVSTSFGGAISVGQTAKLALRYDLNDSVLAASGLLGTVDTSCSLPAAPTRVQFGYDGGGQPLVGYLRRAAIFSRALSDGELQALTAA